MGRETDPLAGTLLTDLQTSTPVSGSRSVVDHRRRCREAATPLGGRTSNDPASPHSTSVSTKADCVRGKAPTLIVCILARIRTRFARCRASHRRRHRHRQATHHTKSRQQQEVCRVCIASCNQYRTDDAAASSTSRLAFIQFFSIDIRCSCSRLSVPRRKSRASTYTKFTPPAARREIHRMAQPSDGHCSR